MVVANGAGSVTSETARLYLDWPLRFAGWFVDSNGLFQTRLVGPAGSNYVIQGWLEGSSWISLVTNHAADGILDFSETMIYPVSDCRAKSLRRTGFTAPC